MSDLIGREIGGFQIVEEIGRGGMATAYKAYQPAMRRNVALKILPPDYSHEPNFVARFKREARIHARLEHPHILPFHASGEQDGIHYTAVSYLTGGTLAYYIRQHDRLDLDDISRLLVQIASALDYVHHQGFVHRDVKPSNVLLDAVGNAFLAGFGIATLAEDEPDPSRTGIVGTPAYMAPELFESGVRMAPTIDQYALGVVLYQMVTGEYPYIADTPLRVMMAHANEPIPDARVHRPDLPDAAQAVIQKGMAKDPKARFESCGDLAGQFAAALVRK